MRFYVQYNKIEAISAETILLHWTINIGNGCINNLIWLKIFFDENIINVNAARIKKTDNRWF